MLCFLCRGYGAIPELHWSNIWKLDNPDPNGTTHVMFGNHKTLAELQQSAQKGCHLCNLILASLEEGAEVAKKSLESFKSNAVTLHVWRDRTHDIITGDDRDECRIDPICTPLEIAQIPTMLQGRGSTTSSYIQGQLRCTLAPRVAEHVGSSAENTDTGSEEALNNIIAWWNTCMKTHATCKQTYKSLPPLPTRVLWVGKASSNSCQLIETRGHQGVYVALSHCWGTVRPLTTTLATLPDRMRGIADSELPPTFKHAAQLCRRLEIQFLWIDSLCIIQDSPEDWRAEAAVMGDVYSRAHCTLAASGAQDSSGGLFWPRDGMKTSPIQLMLFSKACIVERHPDILNEVYGDFRLSDTGPMPLLSRAWVLQEQIFSPRTIGFTRNGLLWNCSELGASERHPFGLPGIPQRRMDVWAGLKDIINKPGLYRTMPHDRIYGLWYRVAMDYNRRSLTRSTDIFPAISALAKAFAASVANDMYLAGLWAGDMHIGLLWRVDGSWRARKHAPDRLVSRRSYPAPSWSWASALEWIWYEHMVPSLDLDEEVTVEQRASILGARIEALHEEYPLGEIATARLGIEGLLVGAELRPDQKEVISRWSLGAHVVTAMRRMRAYPRDQRPNAQPSLGFSHCYFDDEFPESGVYTVALIATTTSKIPNYETRVRHWALILRVVGTEEDGYYRRVGICEVQDDEMGVFDSVEKKIYMLI